MPHYKAGESFKLKKSIEKKNRAKEKSLNKRIKFNDDFIVEESNDYGVVIEEKIYYQELKKMVQEIMILVLLKI